MSKRVLTETYFYTYDNTSYYMAPNKKPKIFIALLQNKFELVIIFLMPTL